jgi:hypothetical protein
MTLRKYSDDEKKILADVAQVRNRYMKEIGVEGFRNLSVEQLEAIVNIVEEIPGYKMLVYKDLQVFMIRKRIEMNGGSLREFN